MGIIHIANATGEKQEYHEAKALDLLNQGILTPDMLYWQDGMSEWKPLSEWNHSAVSSIPDVLEARTGAGKFSFVKDPSFITKFVVFMLGFEILALLFYAFALFGQYQLLNRGIFTEAEANASDLLVGVAGLLGGIVALVGLIVFFVWVYRVNVNSRGFGANFLDATPGWAVGYFFVPFLNLYRPYKTMNEVWHAAIDPNDYKDKEPSTIVSSWWALWIGSWLLSKFIWKRYDEAVLIEDLKAASLAYIGESIVGIILAIVMITMIRTIIANQRKLVSDGRSF